MTRELIEACRRGERGAFDELVERTERQVFTLAYRLVGDRHEAEDVAQESYLRAFRSLRGFRGDSRFETWLYRIVVNTSMTHLRRKGRFGDLLTEGDERLEREDRARYPMEESLERDEVRRALGSLPPGQRTAVVLKDVYGFSCQEIADQIGVTEGAVRVRLHRGRKRLKEAIYGPEAARHGAEDLLPELAEDGSA